jgi:LPS export ABC transporter protein LptC
MEVLARARAVRRLRTAVLVALILLVVGGTALWWIGRSVGRGPDPDAPTTPAATTTATGTLEFTVSDGDRPLFRVRALGGEQERDGVADLERVELTLYGDDGRELQVAADRAKYDTAKREGLLTGNVVVTSEQGLRLESDELSLSNGGRFLTSETPIRFFLGEETKMQGRADHLRFDFRREIFAIAGSVEIWTLDDPREFRLSAGRLLLENEPQRLIRAEIGVRLSERSGSVFARRMAIYFAPDGRHVEFVRGRWQVDGTFTLPESEEARGVRTISTKAQGFSLLLDTATGDPRKLELEGGWLERARLELERPDAGLVVLQARYLQGDFAAGRLSEVLGLGLVEVAETTVGATVPARLACAGRVTAAFTASGEVARLELEEMVDLHQEGFQASGSKAESLASTGESTLTGAPALLLTANGELRAPTVVLRRGGELLEAVGGVDARMPRRGMAMIGSTGAGGEWVQVRSERAQMLQRGQNWSFEGGVRAWSGSDVLTADQLRGQAEGRSLLAAGRVETVVQILRDDGSRSPLRVQAKTLEYAPDRSMALYRGDVVAREEGRRITSQELEIVLDENGQARQVLIRQAVELTESGSGRTVTAERAVYDPGAGTIHFEGQPVVVKDGKGGRLSGRQVDYDVASGRVQVGAGSAAIPESGPGGGR